MFFKNYFNSIAEIINFRYQGSKRNNQNPSDKGELCEIFLKEFLNETLNDLFKIFRGGKVVSSANIESKQLDIVICSKKSLKIFGDKGIYPIETVLGTFSITSTLTKKKLEDCIKEFQSIPKQPRFFYEGMEKEAHIDEPTMQRWNQYVPFKCVWAYSGMLKTEWVKYLNLLVKKGVFDWNLLPDLIVVNKVGMLLKDQDFEFNGFTERLPYYSFEDFHITQNQGSCFSHMLHSLFLASTWESVILPNYSAYFSKDLGYI